MEHTVEHHHVACALCHADDPRAVYRQDEWLVVRCRGCGHCYTDPRPTPQRLASYYNRDYFDDPSLFPDQQFALAVAPRRAMDVESYVQRRGSLLEIGAGHGAFLASMQRRGWEVHGIDFAPAAVEQARRRYQLALFCGAPEDYQPSGLFDAICLFQCLEHLPDPVHVLRYCRAWLVRGGVLVIEVPHADSVDMKFSADRTRLSYDLPRHLHHFTPAILQRLLVREGFDVLDTECQLPALAVRHATAGRPGRPEPPQAAHHSHGTVPPNEGPASPIPLLRKATHWKARLERFVSRLLPGWRFTVVSRKR
jgi:2-polyprenyl-3-methyl-5-hydroxy-6-metoxy-1,4-benzoquinol methylase